MKIYPLPPWRFTNARVLYQPTFVPVKSARAVTPSNRGDKGDGLTLLSLFGWTLGGLFVVDWTHSPIGPYREVAVLSGLVVRDFAIGAWASHIVVNSTDAVESGRDLFGLPTVFGSVDFEENNECDTEVYIDTQQELLVEEIGKLVKDKVLNLAALLKYIAGSAVPGVSEPAEILNRRPSTSPELLTNDGFIWNGDNDVRINGWNGWQSSGINKNCKSVADYDIDSSVGISLPSFSGRLSTHNNKKQTPLLRYPLRLVSARSVRLRPAMNTKFASKVKINDELRAVLIGPRASPCIQIDNVEIVAGSPVEITS